MKLLRFNQFINESKEQDREELKRMMALGLLDEPGYKAHIRRSERDDFLASDKDTSALVDEVLNLPGAKKLLAQGLHLVSSKTQIKHGTYIFSVDPNYNPVNGWGIGFFTSINIIRRITPKGIENLVWRRDKGSMNVKIKSFPDTMQPMEFLDTAMDWAADNIDFEFAKQHPEERTWKYYVKKKSTPNVD